MLYAAQPFDDNAVGGVLSLAKEPKRFPKSERAAPIPAIATQNAVAGTGAAVYSSQALRPAHFGFAQRGWVPCDSILAGALVLSQKKVQSPWEANWLALDA